MLKKLLIGLAALLVVIFIFHSFLIGLFVKPQVEAQASKILGTQVQIKVLSVRLWPGRARLFGVTIKNPEGFSQGNLLDLGTIAVSLDLAGLIKQYTSGKAGPKTVVIEWVKVRGLKFLFERIMRSSAPYSNIDQLIENMNAASPKKAKDETSEPGKLKKENEVNLQLKHFSFKDGRVTVKDATVGKGFEYVVDDINIDYKNIFFPARTASELIEEIEASAVLGKDKSGQFRLQGRGNMMAGVNLDVGLEMESISLSNFNAFVEDQFFTMEEGDFDLKSNISVLNDQLKSQHVLKLNSLKLAARKDKKLIDLPMQTLLAALSQLPTVEVPFEVSGDLKNPQFKITEAFRAAVAGALQRVLSSSLGDLKGIAGDLKGQALGFAEGSSELIKEDAKKVVQSLAGEGSETIDEGLQQLSGMFGKVKKSVSS